MNLDSLKDVLANMPDNPWGFWSIAVLAMTFGIITLRRQKVAADAAKQTVEQTRSVANGAVPGITMAVNAILSGQEADRELNNERHESNVRQFAAIGARLDVLSTPRPVRRKSS